MQTKVRKIVQLAAENIKRLRAVSITPEGNVVQITGRNGQGKTSVLDAIWYALGGKSVQPAEPIRRGAESAKVTLDLGDLVVTRTWSANDKSAVTVASKEGALYSSPQAILDKLVGDLTFDPLAFTRMKPAEQVETLRRLAGVDFADLDKRRADLYEQRRQKNAEAKAQLAHVGQMPKYDLTGDPPNVEDLRRRRDEALAEIRKNDEARRKAEDLRRISEHRSGAVASIRDRVAETERRIVQLQDELRKHREELQSQEQAAEAAERAARDAAALADQLADPDPREIYAAIDAAAEWHNRAKANEHRQEAELVAAAAEQEARALTNRIDWIDEQKREMVANAKMPIDGLGFGDGRVTFRGIPLDQCSSAEQLRVSVAIGSATNPNFRAMCVRDGSLLDADSLRLLEELCEQHGLQVWLERVSDGESVGVVIEDGQVVGAEAGAGHE